MSVAAAVLAVVAAVAIAAVLMTRRDLRAERVARQSSEARAAALSSDLTVTVEARDAALRRAEAVDAELRTARLDGGEHAATRREAVDRLNELEEHVAAAPADDLDAVLTWTLELNRSARTWRHSVAVEPDGVAFSGTTDVLAEALAIERDAAREDIGAVVELDLDIPPGITPTGQFLVLRIAQELLSAVMMASDTTTVRVRGAGADVLVEVDATSADWSSTAPLYVELPASAMVEWGASGARIRDVVSDV